MTQRWLRSVPGLPLSKRISRTTPYIVTAAILAFACTALAAQQSTPPQHPPAWVIAAGGHKEFEVATVRESPVGTPQRGRELILPFDDSAPRGGIFSANLSLLAYIVYAYKIVDLSQVPVLSEHLPDWARSTAYDIESRVDGTATKDQTRLMIQSLLAERFKLSLHTESRQQSVAGLAMVTPGKAGSQLKPHPADETCSEHPQGAPLVGTSGDHPAICGLDVWRKEGLIHVRMTDVTMEQAAGLLGILGTETGGQDTRPVVDQTGLSGHFDFTLEFVPESALSPGNDSAPTGVAGVSLADALKLQLGLKLAKATASVPVYVVDHIEKPSAN